MVGVSFLTGAAAGGVATTDMVMFGFVYILVASKASRDGFSAFQIVADMAAAGFTMGGVAGTSIFFSDLVSLTAAAVVDEFVITIGTCATGKTVVVSDMATGTAAWVAFDYSVKVLVEFITATDAVLFIEALVSVVVAELFCFY